MTPAQTPEVITHRDPALTKPSRVVTGSDDVYSLAEQMLAVLHARGGVGLAAVQIGESVRVFVTMTNGARVFVNPEITSQSETTDAAQEGCLSIPGTRIWVTRPSVIGLRWRDLDGGEHDRTFSGLDARVIQHEMDHLDGILMTTRAVRRAPASRAEVGA